MCKNKFPSGYFFNSANIRNLIIKRPQPVLPIFALFRIILIYTYIYIEGKKNIIR